MSKKKIFISQSNYIPWKGYFNSISNTNIFVVFDEMQYTKRDWRNRNLIKTPNGLKWLTIPVEVKGKYFQKINETKVSDKKWNKSHIGLIKQNYSKAKCYKETIDWVEDLYMNCNFEYLSEINLYFIQEINKYLNINTEIRFSKDFDLHEDRNQRIINICKDLNATDYYSGPAAKFYMDEELFRNNNLKVHYFDYTNFEKYDQLHSDFEHAVSIFDLILNEGDDSVNYFKK
ncbi:MAG: hypothetical protein CBC44_002540 [Flavobacteriales bacterium TMED84]|nr:hypothetical protein [Crocinitomicaceae bacterium]RPG53396.1 MAG: hypothetical protein CBC44_002540 [Flavobacteriales bacterium TMED84]|tara:strand:- start:11185 stop:11877 length:693 start_codon:yes stop_codon:yes gene_type:complete